MPIALHQLPDDVDAVKSLLADQLVRNEQLQVDQQTVNQKNEQLKAQVLTLTEQLNLALARRYAASSEKLSPDQIFCSMKHSWRVKRNSTALPMHQAMTAKIQVTRHIRKKYACDCGECIKTAQLPAQLLPKSMASPGLLADVTVSKYQDALPLYRQETILQRIGVDRPRATIANWMIRAGQLVQPLINLMQDRLLGHDIMQMDESVPRRFEMTYA